MATEKRTTRKPKISWTVKPEGMSLMAWQRALRRQVAEEEMMACTATDERNLPGEYEVRNPQTHRLYKVVYRGEGSPWNYCSCMDFKTSRLGTCKHLEKIKLWIKTEEKQTHTELPAYTSVYLSYTEGRQVKIRVGSDHQEEFRQLAARYFDAQGVMLPLAFGDLNKLHQEALAIDSSFRFYQDAIDYILELREQKLRKEIIGKYSDEQLDQLLAVKLYPYQKEGVRFAFERGRTIIADEMGLGKTVQAIGAAELLRREGLADKVLVVCPTSLKYQWQREIERFTGVPVLVVEGNPLKRKEQYQANMPYKIVSYNCACNDIKTFGFLQTDVLIMDEVQRLKNWNTQISIAARKIQSSYAVILSGTPLENKLEELFSVMEFADNYCLSPFWQFKAHCIMTDATGKVIGYQNLNRIGEQIRSRLIRRTKKQVSLQMPHRQDQNLLVPMTKEQMNIHEEFQSSVAQLVFKWRRMRFLSEKDRQRLLLLLAQMRMVCDSTYILDQKSRYDTKIDETMNILQSVFENGDEKVVIFSQWERMTRLIAHELDRMGVGYEYLHGGVPSRQRKDLINNFTDDPRCRVFLSTDAGSTGLNLQAASIIINLDLPWNPAVLEQRIARIYRIGQARNVQVINLIARGTIEEQMLGKLQFKSAMFEGVLDNGEDTIFLGDQSKFTAMMDKLGDFVEEEQQKPESPEKVCDDSEPLKEEPKQPESVHEQATQNHEESIPESFKDEKKTVSNVPCQPHELLEQGLSFLNGLAQTLQSPEATEAFVETLVKTDNATGQTYLNIPVPDKQTVHTLLGVIGKLFTK